MKANLKQLMLLACFILSFVACTNDSTWTAIHRKVEAVN